MMAPTPLASPFSDEPVGMVIIEQGILVQLLGGQDFPKDLCWIKQSFAHTSGDRSSMVLAAGKSQETRSDKPAERGRQSTGQQ